MRILTEDEYQRRIQDAEARGYERAKHESYMEREDHDFRESAWRTSRNLTACSTSVSNFDGGDNS